MIGDLENCNVMSDGLCTAHNQDGRLCRKQAVDEWDQLRLKHEETLLQVRDLTEILEAAGMAKKIWECGCYVPTWDKRTIIPCPKHVGSGAPAGTARLQNQRLSRMSKKPKS